MIRVTCRTPDGALIGGWNTDDAGKHTPLSPEQELEVRLEAMTDDERRHFENILTLRAYVLGWTGDPLCQPIESVRAAYEQMRQERT